MNARAVEMILDDDFGDQEAAAELVITTDFLPGILSSADKAVGTDLGPDMEELMGEYTQVGWAVRAHGPEDQVE